MNYICNGEKYKYDYGYIYIPININNLPERVKINGIDLILKSSFHVTLFYVKNILTKSPIENLEEIILDLFCKFVSSNEISFSNFKNEFRFVESEDRKSLVIRCEVSNLNNLFNYLSKELNMEIPTQPAHVTLYTLQYDKGIGLNNEDEMETKSILVDVPVEVKNAFEYIL